MQWGEWHYIAQSLKVIKLTVKKYFTFIAQKEHDYRDATRGRIVNYHDN